MQDRYVGDIGDYIKLSLLRNLSRERTLGVAWYLMPDEDHNNDGGHVNYLDDPDSWRGLDPELFDSLREIVQGGNRNVARLENLPTLQGCQFFRERLSLGEINIPDRRDWRTQWFENLVTQLNNTDMVFADPDNGLCEDDKFSYGRVSDMKKIPLREVLTLSEDRPAVIYHHNTRYPGGHDLEVENWLAKLPKGSFAIRARPYNARTFFVINPSKEIRGYAESWIMTWEEHVNTYGL